MYFANSLQACWTYDGDSILVGRRNSTVEELTLRSGLAVSRIFKFPSVSGAVSAVKALPNGRHFLSASHDNLRLYDFEAHNNPNHKVPFYIIPGHHGGCISSICEYTKLIVFRGGEYLELTFLQMWTRAANT